MNNKECCTSHGEKDHECCGDDCCNHDHEEHNTVTLELEDGSELVCPIIELFKVNEKEYIAVYNPVDENVLMYRFFDYEDGTVELSDIEDSDYSSVADAFLALQDETEEG